MKKSKNKNTRTEVPTPLSQQVVFLDPTGTSTNGPLISLPSKKPGRIRKVNDTAWTQNQTIRRFRRYFENERSSDIDAVMRAMNRLDCWRAAVDQLLKGPSPNETKGRALLSFWNTYGLHSIGRGLKENLPHIIDAFKYLLPPHTGEGLTLYRGEVASRHIIGVYGISWTAIFDKARQFANIRSPEEGHGVVLKIEATPQMIAVAVKEFSKHTLTLGEDEYLVDPRLIQGKVSVVS